MERRILPCGIALVLSVTLALPAVAQFASPVHIVPVIAKIKGAQGTDWRSDGAITNVSGTTVTVSMEFFRQETSNTFTGNFSASFTLAPGQTKTVEDILGTYFPGEGNNTKGMLLIMAEAAGDADALLAVSTRTYNAANPMATYGQTVPSTFIGFVFGLGRSVLPGVTYDSRFRTNVGICNFGPIAADVVIDIYNASGSKVATVPRTVESFSLRQWSLADLGVPNLTGGRVEVKLGASTPGFNPCDPGSSPFFSSLLMTYFSKVDNATGDAEFGMGQVVWDDYVDTCGSDPSEGCGGSASSIAVLNATAAVVR